MKQQNRGIKIGTVEVSFSRIILPVQAVHMPQCEFGSFMLNSLAAFSAILFYDLLILTASTYIILLMIIPKLSLNLTDWSWYN